jgi:hypothetical protein
MQDSGVGYTIPLILIMARASLLWRGPPYYGAGLLIMARASLLWRGPPYYGAGLVLYTTTTITTTALQVLSSVIA